MKNLLIMFSFSIVMLGVLVSAGYLSGTSTTAIDSSATVNSENPNLKQEILDWTNAGLEAIDTQHVSQKRIREEPNLPQFGPAPEEVRVYTAETPLEKELLILGAWEIVLNGYTPNTQASGILGIIKTVDGYALRGVINNDTIMFEGEGKFEEKMFTLNFQVKSQENSSTQWTVTDKAIAELYVSEDGTYMEGSFFRVNLDPAPEPNQQEIVQGIIRLNKLIITN